MGWLDYVNPLLGVVSTLAGANNQKQAATGAANGATFNPTNVNSPFGSTSYSVQNGVPTYNVSPGLYGPLTPLLGNLASAGYGGSTGALAGANNAETALANTGNAHADVLNNLALADLPGITDFLQGKGTLGGNSTNLLNSASSFLSNTDPSKIYDLLTQMAQPGETSATQNMFDQLQGTGRLGLTQNGELGDLGGLDLAQKTAQNARMAQAYGFGQQNAQLGGQLGLGLQAQGNANTGIFGNLLTDALNSRAAATGAKQNILSNDVGAGNSGLEGLLGINQATMLPLATSLTASADRANAGANAGQFKMLGSSGLTDLLSSVGQGLLTKSPTGGTSGSTLGNTIQNMFGGSSAAAPSAAATAAGGVGNIAGAAGVPGLAGDVAAASDIGTGIGAGAGGLGAGAGGTAVGAGDAALGGAAAGGTAAGGGATAAGAGAGSTLGAVAGGVGMAALLAYEAGHGQPSSWRGTLGADLSTPADLRGKPVYSQDQYAPKGSIARRIWDEYIKSYAQTKQQQLLAGKRDRAPIQLA